LVFEVLDCVDGEVARLSGVSTIKGYYLDLVSHVICNQLHKILLPLHLYLLSLDPVLLIAAFFIYAFSMIEHAVRTCFDLATYGIKSETTPAVEESEKPRAEVVWLRSVKSLKCIAFYPINDLFMLKLVYFLLIVLSYYYYPHWK